jgi:hypothetical protein
VRSIGAQAARHPRGISRQEVSPEISPSFYIVNRQRIISSHPHRFIGILSLSYFDQLLARIPEKIPERCCKSSLHRQQQPKHWR